MSNVYIVTSGEYSAYCINRVFSSEEKAKEFIKITRDLYGGTFNIEPYELDAPMPTYKEYLFFEAYIEDDIVAKSNLSSILLMSLMRSNSLGSLMALMIRFV